MYAINISGSVDEMLRRHDAVMRAGGTCVMVSVNWVGFAGVAHHLLGCVTPQHGMLHVHDVHDHIRNGDPVKLDFSLGAVLIAVGQENAFPWIEADSGISFDKQGLPVLGKDSFQSTVANVFFGGDSALGPRNIITAVAHGHEAAVSIDRMLNGEDIAVRPAPMTNLMSQKMGIHEWSFDNDVSLDERFKVPWAKAAQQSTCAPSN